MTARRSGERGAALVLAIAFMVVIGAVGGAVITMLASGLNNRVSLDQARNREYAADGAIQAAIAQIRGGPAAAGPELACPTIPDHPLDGFTIHVDCAPAPTITRDLYRQLDAIFTTCEQNAVSGGKCPSSRVIIRAQVNFQAVGSGASPQIQRTWVQAWSVNR